MSKVVATTHLTLDGVMQSPARPDEDTRDGFTHGGWAAPYGDAVMASVTAEGMAQGGAILLGRRTYEDIYSVWPNRNDGNPFTPALNNAQKYVASTTLTEPLPWQNSTLLKGDAADAVAALKAQPGKDLVIIGSGVLVQSLLRRNLIDEFLLLIYPLVFGSGRRLFADDGTSAPLRLVSAQPTTTGVLIARYQPAVPPSAS